MKHVGMNIAADPLNYIGQTGVKGGMVIIIGTDPGARCSTGEEDVHWYVSQTKLPLFLILNYPSKGGWPFPPMVLPSPLSSMYLFFISLSSLPSMFPIHI